MYRRLVALLVAVVIGFSAPQIAQAAPVRPAPHSRAVQAVARTNDPTPKPRKMTKAVKHERAVALKILKKAQHKKKLDFSKAWKVTHNWTILKRYVYGLKLGGGHAVSGTADRARLARVEKAADVMLAKQSCHGKTDLKAYVGYWRLRLNSCKATTGEYAAVFIAASVAFLGTILPSPSFKAVSAFSEFFFTVGAAALAYCNRNSRGVRVFWTLVAGGISVLFCKQQ